MRFDIYQNYINIAYFMLDFSLKKASSIKIKLSHSQKNSKYKTSSFIFVNFFSIALFSSVSIENITFLHMDSAPGRARARY